jgi:glutamate carboxypeptidase
MLGLPCREELRSGVSDMNTIAEAGIPVVDGLGPIGDCDHCDREYMIKDSLSSRTKLAALAILSSWEHFS